MQKSHWRQLAVAALIALIAGCATAEKPHVYVADSAITAKVKARLFNAEDLNATRITVKTANGVVQLSGSVESRADEQRAIRLAHTIDGVKDVKSRLTVGGAQGGQSR